MRNYNTHSSAETKALGASLAKKVLRGIQNKKSAIVIALRGDLGAGKTTFVQGFMRGMGHRGRVTSPTFVLFRRLALSERSASKGRFRHIYHVDAYRIRKQKEFLVLGFKEILKDPANIILVEWPERLDRLLPIHTIWIFFAHHEKEEERKITY